MTEILEDARTTFFEVVGAAKLIESVTNTTFAESIISTPDIIMRDPMGIAHPK